MNGSNNDFESHIGLFLEHVKRSAARAMEDRGGNDGWLGNENVAHTIVKRSRSGMSSSDDGITNSSVCFRLEERMDVGENNKAAGEILRSLLITPKMENSQIAEVNDWHKIDQNEPIVWQIETNNTGKQYLVSEMQNVMAPTPITYLTPGDRNLTFSNPRTLIKPLTYILSRNDFSETPKYCINGSNEENVIVSESQQILLVQNISTDAALKKSEAFEMVGAQTKKNIKNIECQNVISIRKERNNKKKNLKEKKSEKTKKKSSNAILLKRKERENRKDYCSSVKSKVDRKVNNNKKCLRKKKSKPKSKLKGNGKPFAKTPLKTMKTIDHDKDDDDDNISEGEITRKNLFELIKLEDNVDQVAERLNFGCDCADSNCFDGLNPEKVFRHRLNIADLTKAEHDMYLMGVIMASVQNLQETSRHKERIRIRSCYAYEGKKICLTAFLYLQHVTLYQMKRLRSHLKIHGVSPRIHGNRGRKPSNTFSLDIYRCATNFVQNYVENRCTKSVPNFTTFSSNKIGNNSISGSNLPSAKNVGKKCTKMTKIVNKMTLYHLPSECTKKTVHEEYILFCERLKPGQKVMKYSTFTSFLQHQFPNVKFPKMDKKPAVKCVQKDLEKIPKDNKNKSKDDKYKTEKFADKNIQTPSVIYIPTKTLHVAQPTFHLIPKPPPPQLHDRAQIINSLGVRDPQTVLNSKQIENLSEGNGSDLETHLKYSSKLMVENQIGKGQSVGQSTSNEQNIFTTNNLA